VRATGISNPHDNKAPDNGVMLVDGSEDVEKIVNLLNGNDGTSLNGSSKKYANTDTNETQRLILKAGKSYKIKVTPGSDWWENNLSLTVDVNNNFVEENDNRVKKELVDVFAGGFSSDAYANSKVSTNEILEVNDSIPGEGNKTAKLTFKFKDEFGGENETYVYAVIDRLPLPCFFSLFYIIPKCVVYEEI